MKLPLSIIEALMLIQPLHAVHASPYCQIALRRCKPPFPSLSQRILLPSWIAANQLSEGVINT